MTPSGIAILDNYFDELGVVVEVNGIQHEFAENVVADALRNNELVIAHERVLEIPVLGLRTRPDDFMDQVRRMLAAAHGERAA